MNIHNQIADLLQANFEGLPLPDRLGAASVLSTLYHFVVDNDLEQDYCSREPILAAADRCYTALLMSYINCDSQAQATKILLAQADLIFGLQAVPNRRRVDCFLTAATKHLTQTLTPHAQSPMPKAMDVASIAKAQSPMPKAMDVASIAKAQCPMPNAMDVASITKAQSPMPQAMDVASIAKAQSPMPKAMDVASIAKAQCPMPNAMETLVSIILTFGGNLPKDVENLLATSEESHAPRPTPNAAAPAHRFSALQNTISKLEEEIQSSLLV